MKEGTKVDTERERKGKATGDSVGALFVVSFFSILFLRILKLSLSLLHLPSLWIHLHVWLRKIFSLLSLFLFSLLVSLSSIILALPSFATFTYSLSLSLSLSLSPSFSFFVFYLSPLCTHTLSPFLDSFHCQPPSTLPSRCSHIVTCESPSGKEGKRGKHRRKEKRIKYAHACGRGDIYERPTNQAHRSQRLRRRGKRQLIRRFCLSHRPSSRGAPLCASSRILSCSPFSSSMIWNTFFSLSLSLSRMFCFIEDR